MDTVERTGTMRRITPKPRILKALGQIEFNPWQCIAELVDNSFDEFLDIERTETGWTEPFDVSIQLPPGAGNGQVDGVVRVVDNGRGMTLDRVTDAVSAGYSGNDPLSKLGLFGMGFNVATARMGSVTRFLTTREGDSDWVGVEIDLDAIKEGFEVPEIRVPKDSPSQHGTRVEISRLEDFSAWFTRPGNQSRLRDILGGVYSYLLAGKEYRLLVNGIAVKPYRHCVWSADRFVTREGEAIPARIEIDRDLGPRAFCRTCSTWQEADGSTCEECESTDLEVRERRVWGWLGIERYLDDREYGIDFLRNGRKIRRFDKSIFQWRDPEDQSGPGETEYPLEVPYNVGRIVGEIHLDHVPVVYTKDSFDTSDRGWRKAIEIIRGEGPLLPKRASQLGYSRNDSPLGKLHRGYRRNDPGANYLTPGNGKSRVDNRDWDKKFRAGDPEYQSDSLWYRAVLEHDAAVQAEKDRKKAETAAEGASRADPTIEFTTGSGEADEQEKASPPATQERPEADADRAARLARSASQLLELKGEYAATGVPGRPFSLSAYLVEEVLKGADGKRQPVWITSGRGGSMTAFADLSHPHFRRFSDDPADMILVEVAQQMLVRGTGATSTIGAVYAELKAHHLSSRAIEPGTLIGEATQLLRDIQERMVACVGENPARPWSNALNESERHITGDRINEILKKTDIEGVVVSGEYLPLVPATVVPRIVEEWPEAFFDGRLFDAPYAGVASTSARRQIVSTVTGYLDDAAWLASAPPHPSKDQLVRAGLSLRLVPDTLAAK